ncbi:MAG: polysaccharide lyase 8 family protein [Bryobacterales bacterium]|nr:polysaccharide lyase 8 family protein [Bryobacterales bacterium]
MKRTLLLVLCAATLQADEFDTLRLRWRNTLTGGASDLSVPQIRSRLASIESTARSNWDRMDKFADRRALWSDLASASNSSQITSNFRRIRDMALAWATPGQALHASGDLLAATRSALDWMEANRYHARVTVKYDNWWDWEIGAPIELGNILTLLHEVLTPEEIARQAAAIDRFVADPRIMITSTVSTGANRVWKCKAAILRAVAVRDEAKLKLSSDALDPVFAYVVSGDGFYEDGSFIQHGRHPYTGGYGKSLLADLADLLYLLNGSAWEFRQPSRDNLYRWIFESFEPVLYRGAMMDMVRGREVSRSGSTDHAVGHATAASILRVSQFAPAELAASMRSMLKAFYLSDDSRDWAAGRSMEEIMAIRQLLNDSAVERRGELTGSWVFASMDRIVHLRPGWGFGIAMHSSRVYNFESINSENLRAWHTADGMTFLFNSDLTQYTDNYWPTADPQRLAGTTVITGSTARQSQLNGSSIAGGVSIDGFTGAMMQLRPDGRQMDARKSWFLFDNEVVALGSGIQAMQAASTVATIVENRLVRDEPPFARAEDGTWAHLASPDTGYYFPGEKDWKQERVSRTGSWSLINAGGSATNLTRRFHSIWFDHGIAPGDASYAYAVLPGASEAETQGYAATPEFTVVENSAAAHAVTEMTLGITAANFWSNTVHSSGGVSSDRVACVLLRARDGQLHLGVADPTQASAPIHIEIERGAAAVLEKDDAITIDQLSPTLKLTVHPEGALGRTLRASFTLP